MKYKKSSENELSQNVRADIFDSNKKENELYFSIEFYLNFIQRGIVADWTIKNNKLAVRIMKKGLDKIKNLNTKYLQSLKDSKAEFYNHYKIRDNELPTTLDLTAMLGTRKNNIKEIIGYHEIATVKSNIYLFLPDWEVDLLLQDRIKVLKHAKIDSLPDDEVVPYEGRMDVDRVEFLLSLTEIEVLVKLLERIEKDQIPDSETDDDVIEIREDYFSILYKKPCICIECNKNEVKGEYLLRQDDEDIKVGFYKNELLELLWALRRIFEKYSKEIAEVGRIKIAK